MEYFSSWKRDPDIYNNMDEPGGHHAKNNPDTERKKTSFHLYVESKRVKYIKSREQNAGYQGQGGGNRGDTG